MDRLFDLLPDGLRMPWWGYLVTLVGLLGLVALALFAVRPPMGRRRRHRRLRVPVPTPVDRWVPPPVQPGAPALPRRGGRHAATMLTPPGRLLGQRYLRMAGAPPRPHARPEPPGAPGPNPGQTVR